MKEGVDQDWKESGSLFDHDWREKNSLGTGGLVPVCSHRPSLRALGKYELDPERVVKFLFPPRWSAIASPALLACEPLGVASWDHGSWNSQSPWGLSNLEPMRPKPPWFGHLFCLWSPCMRKAWCPKQPRTNYSAMPSSQRHLKTLRGRHLCHTHSLSMAP